MKKYQPPASKALPCACGGHFGNVIASRGTPRGEIWRRRKCDRCNARITTYEAVRDGDDLALATPTDSAVTNPNAETDR